MNKEILYQNAKKIKLLLMDVDGVLTDGKIYFIQNADDKIEETKGFNTFDGIGLRLVNQFGIKTGIITGRVSPAVKKRAKDLAMAYLCQGFISKLKALELIARAEGLKYEEIAYVGDDWTDIPLLKTIGLSCCPQNSRPEVKECAHYTAPSRGGEGAIRDICELILYSQGFKEEIKKQVLNGIWPIIKKPKLQIITEKE